MIKNGNGKRRAQRIPEILTDSERAAVLSQLTLTFSSSVADVRNLAMVRILLNCGLRSAELCSLEVRNIDWQSGQMKVMGKGQKERVLWIGDDDLILLQKWLELRPSSKLGSSSKLVFTSLDGAKPICSRWFRRFIRRLGEKAGLNHNFHPHVCRHSFATRLLSQSKNLYLVSRALGHASVATTQVYLSLNDSELADAMKKLGGQDDPTTA